MTARRHYEPDDELVQTDIMDKASHSTRNAIIAIVKQNGETSMKTIASALGISKMAVSKHLSNLERDRLVQKRVLRAGVGRPEYRYSLTPNAHYLFPTSYPYIALSALSFIEEKTGRDGINEFFERRKSELMARYSARLANLSSEEKVRELARIREEEGFLAEAERLPDGTAILAEHNCPLMQVASRYGAACSKELELFRSLLGDRVERTHWIVDGQHMCRYVIRPKEPGC
ncbi:MAG: transcriptional regulator [Thermoplasmata archaeon YP2-bin.285]|uniref:Transcriptional regulator n=1 Tax=Candidatus Sysuiplasma superficiale TaxID=2823368 RepID=A0A8J8CB16_9ARCH|nr:transcriptional regulator [Candidatus Sysuiplasma superficiale]